MRRFATLALLAIATAWSADLDGRIVEDHSGNPLASVEVRVYRTGQRTLAAHLETDGSGRFHAPNLPDGEYRIEATKANFVGATLRFHGPSTGLLLRLVRCGVISGTVRDGQSKPVLGASVYVLAKGPGEAPPRPVEATSYSITRVDVDGRFRIHGLPPGEYAIAASYGASTAMFGQSGGAEVNALGSGVQLYPTSQRPQYFAITGGEQYRNVDFAILPSTLHRVRGKVELPDPKHRFWLALFPADHPLLATAVAATDKDGGFALEGVPSGAYTLTASGPIGGYGGKGIVNPPPGYYARMPLSVTIDVEGVAVAPQRGRSATVELKPSGEGCPNKAQIALTGEEDFAVRIDKNGEVTTERPLTLSDLAPARYQVVASNLGDSCFQPSIPTADLSSGAPAAPIAVPLAPAGAIHGKLTGASNPTQYSIALVAADPDTSSRPLQIVFPDSSGRFTFGGLRPGRYRLVTQIAGEASARWITDPARMIEFQIPAGSPTEIELPVPKRSNR
jgi:hypothetical protein